MLVSNVTRLCLLTGTILSTILVSNAYAGETDSLHEAAERAGLSTSSYPHIGGEVVMELQNEYTVDSDDPATDEHNNMFFRTEVAPTLAINENFHIDGVAVLENIQDRDPNDNNYFDNEGIFIEEIKLNYENGAWAAWAGKFNPAFGIAWDFGRGIWGEDFAEDYEITEKLGVGGSYTYGNESIGAHTLAANTFFADTTFLSGSVITKRDQLDKKDGGVSNTEDFSSFVVSLEGEDLAGVENLYYKLGYRNQAEGDASVGDHETGYVATIGHAVSLSDRVGVDGLVEYVDISNFENSTSDNRYFTTSLITTIDEQWNVTASYTDRDIRTPGAADVDDYLLQVSGGYDFGQGTTAEIGWRSSEEGGVDSDVVGGLIRHSFAF